MTATIDDTQIKPPSQAPGAFPYPKGADMQVWKTEILLNTRGRGLPFDSDRMHRILTRAIDGPDYLWSHPRPGVLLVQSARPLAPETFRHEAVSIRSKCVSLDYERGDRLEIAGIVAPTKAKRREGRHSQKIHLAAEHTPAWLMRRFAGAATLDTITIEDMSPSTGTRPDGTRIIHPRVAFHCWATVTDQSNLATLATTGIGSGKRFGCGMLTIRTSGREAA